MSYIQPFIAPQDEAVMNNTSLTAFINNPFQFCYNNAGVFTSVVPDGVNYATFRLWGAGGGSTLLNGTNVVSPGGGGGYVRKTISTSPGSTYVVTVGAGGGNPATGSGLGGLPALYNTLPSVNVGGIGGQYSAVHSLTGGQYTLICCAGGGAGANPVSATNIGIVSTGNSSGINFSITGTSVYSCGGQGSNGNTGAQLVQNSFNNIISNISYSGGGGGFGGGSGGSDAFPQGAGGGNYIGITGTGDVICASSGSFSGGILDPFYGLTLNAGAGNQFLPGASSTPDGAVVIFYWLQPSGILLNNNLHVLSNSIAGASVSQTYVNATGCTTMLTDFTGTFGSLCPTGTTVINNYASDFQALTVKSNSVSLQKTMYVASVNYTGANFSINTPYVFNNMTGNSTTLYLPDTTGALYEANVQGTGINVLGSLSNVSWLTSATMITGSHSAFAANALILVNGSGSNTLSYACTGLSSFSGYLKVQALTP